MRPILFSILGWPVQGFFAMVLLGIVVSTLVGLALAKRRGYPMLQFATLAIFSVVVGLLGARIYSFLFNLVARGGPSVPGEGVFFLIRTAWRSAGRSIIGTIIAFSLFALWYIHRVGLPRWATADIAVAVFPLGQAFGRIGCFLNGCCYGRPTDSSLGVIFPGRSGPVHPAQLYEMAADLAIFGILMAVLSRKKFDGQICGFYLMLYAAVRFAVEYFRGDPGRGYLITGSSPWLSLSLPQGWAIVGCLFGIGIYLHRRRVGERWSVHP